MILFKLRKILIGLIFLVVFTFLGIIGFNTYINYQKYGFKRERENERLAKQKEREAKEKLDREIAEMQRDQMSGWNPKGKGTILKPEEINHLGMIDHPMISCSKCNVCEDCSNGNDCHKMQPKLIFTDKVNHYLRNVIQAFTDFKNGNNLEDDSYNDNVSPFLKRYNAVMYGAPGTGKTELINELVHHLFEKFNNPAKTSLEKEIEKLEKELDVLKKRQNKIGQRSQEVTSQDKLIEKQISDLENNLNPKKQRLETLEKNNRIPPVFKIDGAKLQTAGESLGQPSPETKLIKFIAYCKKEVFGDAYSKEPYVIFVEEADQGINVMTAGSGGKKNNLLEEYKNFLSTSEDKAGLQAGAQDSNSIVIIATNNYELIDPAVVRRGRLGEKLNFNWTPALLEKYGERNDSEWEKVHWPKNDIGWQFVNNVNYEELYKMCSKFGYSKFADNFTVKTRARMNDSSLVNKANQIINSYKNLSSEDKKNKEKELGLYPTGKKITVNGKEENERICNWLLHFLFTFHRYNDRQDLSSFTNAQQIQPYDFGEAFATREAIWGVYKQLGEQVTAMNIAKNIVAEIAKDIRTIGQLMVETANVQDQLREVQNKINETISDVNSMRSDISSLRSIISQFGSSSEISALRDRLSALEKGLSSSGSSSSSSDVRSRMSSPIDELRAKINELINHVGSSDKTRALLSAFNSLVDAYNG